MWGMDSRGLTTIDSELEQSFRVAGAFVASEREFDVFDLLATAFPTKADGEPMSKSHLRQLAKNKALKWGPLLIEPDEINDHWDTNQDFVVLSAGKRNKVMVFFE